MGGLRRIIRHVTDLLGMPTPQEGKFLKWKHDLSGLENADSPADGHTHMVDVMPIEVVNGTRQMFSIDDEFRADSLTVYVSGIRLHKGVDNDYEIIDTKTFRFYEAPEADEKIVVDYIKL